MARVIFGALSWGLGHVTRDLPIIHSLLDHGHHVSVATSGRALQLLRQDAPQCDLVEFPDYPAPYSKRGFFVTKFAFNLNHLFLAIHRERAAARRLIDAGDYDLVISDNRFNFFHPDLPSFFISHQLKFAFPAPLQGLTLVSGFYNARYHRQYRRVIVPDYPDPHHCLSGILSHGFPVNLSRPYYAGVLASVRKLNLPRDIDLFISISGPEPQRTAFENLVRAQLPSLPRDWNVVVTLGKPGGPETPETLGNVTIHSFCGRPMQQEMLNRAKMVVARTGYTTVMELAELNTKALLIPTPGQTEQVYLGNLYRKLALFHCVSQRNLDLLRDIEIARTFPGITWDCSTADSVNRLYQDLFAPILDK